MTYSDVLCEALHRCTVGGGGKGTGAVVSRRAVGALGAGASVPEGHRVRAVCGDIDDQFMDLGKLISWR